MDLDRDRRSAIQDFLKEYRKSIIQSEAEVRSKFIVPLLSLLGYPSEFRAEEFPVYGYEGGKKLPAKNADFILFDANDFGNHRTRTQDNLAWVYDHSILVVEAKKPGEMPNDHDLGQAQFYTAWTRAIAYVETDGEILIGRYYNSAHNDYEVINLKVDELSTHIGLLTTATGLRNGYFHKENLSDWSKVEEDRTLTLLAFYLLLGAYNFGGEAISFFGFVAPVEKSEREKLFEYAHKKAFSSNGLEIPVVYFEEHKEKWEFFLLLPDDYIEYDQFGEPHYSGMYFRSLDKTRRPGKIGNGEFPQEISEGRLIISRNVPISFTATGPEQVIFQDGRFCGDLDSHITD